MHIDISMFWSTYISFYELVCKRRRVIHHPLTDTHDAKHLHNKIKNETEQLVKEGVQKNGNASKGSIDRVEDGVDCEIERKVGNDITW